MSGRPSWAGWAIGIAEAASERSEDPFFRVGAVALRRDFTVAGIGYNGAPHGVQLDWQMRDDRRLRVIHAEVNALRTATVADMDGGVVATTHIPCGSCLTVLASYRITLVWFLNTLDPNVYDHEQLRSIADSCHIDLYQYTKETDSVRRFSV